MRTFLDLVHTFALFAFGVFAALSVDITAAQRAQHANFTERGGPRVCDCTP